MRRHDNHPVEVGVIGAGQTGRGFIGRLLAERGVPFLLIDSDEEIVEALERSGSYAVRFYGDVRAPVRIERFHAMSSKTLPPEDMAGSLRVMFVSVGAHNLSTAGQYIGALIGRRMACAQQRCLVIMCENARDASGTLLDSSVRVVGPHRREELMRVLEVVNAAVFCTTSTISKGTLNIVSEDYPSLECGNTTFVPKSIDLSFLKPVADMDGLMKRKLFTYNALSAILAYNGWWKGYRFLAEAWADAEIQDMGRAYLKEINEAIILGMRVELTEQEHFAAMAIAKFSNPEIADSIERNARDALRKLSPGERIIGSLSLLRSVGRSDTSLVQVAALMLLYSNQVEGVPTLNTDEALVQRLSEVTRLPQNDAFIAAVVNRILSLQ